MAWHMYEGSICDSRYIETLFFAKCSCVVLVCLIPAPILFAMKQQKVRFFVYLGNRQIIGAVLSCHAFELISPLSGIKNIVFNSNFIISYSLGLK